jgi:hypothetical protein
MKDKAKKDFLDAKLELGTEVQFFEFGFDEVVNYSTLLALIIVLLYWLTPIGTTFLLGLYIGAIISLILFYIKFGTN